VVKKIRCTVTGNIIYITEKRYARMVAKYGDEQTLNSTYVSMAGRKMASGELDTHQNFKNRIRCAISGKWCAITNQRLAAGIKKYGSEAALRERYICRTAAKLLREGKTEDEIRDMVANKIFPEK
jgi:hypothetical protein